MGGKREGCQKQQDSGGGAVGRRSNLVSIHTIPSAHVSTWRKSCQLREPPCPCLGKADSHPQLASSQDGCENKVGLGSWATVPDPDH